MPTDKQIKVAHQAWEEATKCWKLHDGMVVGTYTVHYIPSLGSPGEDIEVVTGDKASLHIFHDKSDALWFKREKCIIAILEAVEAMNKEGTADVEG